MIVFLFVDIDKSWILQHLKLKAVNKTKGQRTILRVAIGARGPFHRPEGLTAFGFKSQAVVTNPA
jgi:hypothetical protein